MKGRKDEGGRGAGGPAGVSTDRFVVAFPHTIKDIAEETVLRQLHRFFTRIADEEGRRTRVEGEDRGGMGLRSSGVSLRGQTGRTAPSLVAGERGAGGGRPRIRHRSAPRGLKGGREKDRWGIPKVRNSEEHVFTN